MIYKISQKCHQSLFFSEISFFQVTFVIAFKNYEQGFIWRCFCFCKDSILKYVVSLICMSGHRINDVSVLKVSRTSPSNDKQARNYIDSSVPWQYKNHGFTYLLVSVGQTIDTNMRYRGPWQQQIVIIQTSVESRRANVHTNVAYMFLRWIVLLYQKSIQCQ